MFTHTTRLVTLSGRRSMSTVTRKLPTSILSLHRSFPETLYKVNPGERSNIVDPVSFPRSEHFYDRDEVENVVGGHVYPTITSSILHGALFFPHTRSLEETSKMTLDWYYDALDEGLEPVSPHIFRIPKEVPVPDPLILVHHHHGWFSLQPVKAILLEELNNTLDKFYFKYAERIPVQEWLEEYCHGYERTGG